MAWSEYLLVMRSRLSLQLSTRQQRRLPNIGRARLVLRDAGRTELLINRLQHGARMLGLRVGGREHQLRYVALACAFV